MAVRARLALASSLVLGAVLVAGPAAAEPPLDVPGELTDLAGVVDDEARVQAALDELAETTDLQLFVVYVETFDGMDPVDWADETAVMSRLGVDDLLLAVAVGDRTYRVSVDPDAVLSDAQLARVEREAIEPALRAGDWDGAAVAAAEAYAAAVTPTPFPVVPVAGGLGVVALAGGGFVLWRRRRAAAAVREELEALDREASLALVAADDAVQRSTTEVGFAEAQFGADAVEPFRQALARARAELTAAFGLRQRLDDAEPESPDERRAMLRRVLEHCETLDATLDAKTAEIEKLRDLWATAPARLADLRTRVTAVGGAAQAARGSVAALARTFTGTLVAEAQAAPDAAAALAAEALETVDRGLATVDADRAAAVQAAHEAEDALGQAQSLLDLVTVLVVDLREAPERIDAAVASVTDDLTDVTRLAAGDEAIAAAETEARAAITDATGQRTSGDPLAALERLAAAEAALDALLEPLREHERRVERARSRLGTMMPELSRDLATVSGLISANRSAVGSVARTRYSEAQRQADLAGAHLTDDPLVALPAAEAAARLVTEAWRRSRSDIDSYRARRSSSSSWGGGGYSSGYSTGWGGSGRSRGSSWGSSSGSSARRSSSSSSRRSSSSRSSSRSRGSSGASGRSRRGGGGRF